MRYMIITYMKRANGQIDEEVTVAKNLKTRDLQTASVIIDFRKQKVEKASLQGTTIARDWTTIVTYYHQHYASTIDRLCKENGYSIDFDNKEGNSNEEAIQQSNPN